MKLYLDDRRTPPRDEGYLAADNYADFLALLDKYRVVWKQWILTMISDGTACSTDTMLLRT